MPGAPHKAQVSLATSTVSPLCAPIPLLPCSYPLSPKRSSLSTTSVSYDTLCSVMAYGIPFIFEDKRGRLHNTELKEVEDRMILRVSTSSSERRSSDGSLTLKIYEYGTARASSPKTSDGPSIVLEFGQRGQLGTIWFANRSSSMQMSQWLRPISGAGSRPAASFTCSDSQVYTWIHRPEHEAEAEWACQCQTSSVAARYYLKPPSESFGNSFTVEEAFAPLIPELLASLIIMRHVQEYLKN